MWKIIIIIVFFFNANQQFRTDIVQHTTYTPTAYVGRYIKVNIDSERTTKEKFNHIIDKI